MFDIFGTQEASTPASEQWVNTVSKMVADMGWPGEIAHLLLIVFALLFFLIQLKRFIGYALFSESGLLADGMIVDVADGPSGHNKAEIAFIACDGRRYLFGHRAKYDALDRGREVEVLYAPTNPQRATVRRRTSGPAMQFVISIGVAAACVWYGLTPVLQGVTGG